MAPPPAIESPVLWSEDGVPRSRLFDDVYYSTADGLAESRAVFLAGCHLPEAWRGRDRFTVGELGFGSSLNILALLALWRETREPGARLNIFSVEAFPMTAGDVRRALAAWPELDDLAEMLLARWPRRARGFHRIEFSEIGAVLDLAILDVGEALAEWTGAADAWFLDGFSPARNPAMWTPEILAAVAARSAPGARAATFTVAGAVRRGLAAAGFSVEKQPGHGRKAERLEARLETSTAAAPPPSRPRVAIIGAGVAGAALARAFSAEQCVPLLIEADTAGAGASGNPAALVAPRLDAGDGAVAALYAQALARAADLTDRDPIAVIAHGCLQLEAADKDPGRFDRIADSALFEPGALARLGAAAAGGRLGEAAAVGGLFIRDARVVEPARLLARWLGGGELLRAEVASLAREGGAWRLLDRAGGEIARAEVVCIAAGAGARALAPALPLSVVRGQVSLAATAARTLPAIWGGYVVPARRGLLFGATHDRGDASIDPRPQDHRRNLADLARARPGLAATIDPDRLEGRASLRVTSPDFLPVAGAVPAPGAAGEAAPGLFILSALGSRGFCAAPLLAEHISALALGAASPLPRSLAQIVDPARFGRRAARKLERAPRRRAIKSMSATPSRKETT